MTMVWHARTLVTALLFLRPTSRFPAITRLGSALAPGVPRGHGPGGCHGPRAQRIGHRAQAL